MTEENTLEQGGGEALPAAEVPKNDAEAAALEAKQQEAAQEKPKEDESRKKNRTGEYINRLQSELAEWRSGSRQFQQPQKTTQQAPAEEPTLDQFNFDPVAYQRAHSEWAVQKALRADREARSQEEARRQQETLQIGYAHKVADFVEAHPDFVQTVSRMPQLPPAIEAAIMGSENGPEIAYHLANNADELLRLAATPPQYADYAVSQLASRLTAAPQAPQIPQQSRPVSQAPAPVPTVKGKTPTETPSEKLTDDQWWRKRQAKRAS